MTEPKTDINQWLTRPKSFAPYTGDNKFAVIKQKSWKQQFNTHLKHQELNQFQRIHYGAVLYIGQKNRKKTGLDGQLLLLLVMDVYLQSLQWL